MKNRSLGFLAATVAFAVFGGLHLEIASGRSLESIPPNDARLRTGTSLVAEGVNRPAKGDRGEVSLSGAEGRTITFKHPELPSTTVAVRLWETVGVVKGRTAPKGAKDAAKPKQAVACEGVVSVLTEVAKQLDAGRCVT
jgi:hypothetical protein